MLTQAPTQSTSLYNSSAARQKINQALQLLGTAREENTGLTDVFEAASAELAGFEDHVKAIEFDRPTRDVSAHGTALRGKTQEADADITAGKPGQESVVSLAEQIDVLIDGALADVGDGNRQAKYRLDAAKRDMDFAQENNIPFTGYALTHSSRILTQDLDPYLTEVEEDSPGRDVGRFADDIEEMFKDADVRLKSAPIYIDSTERSFSEIKKELEAARSAL